MTSLNVQLNGLLLEIRNARPEARYRLQPQLERLIGQLNQNGEPVTEATRALNDELRYEAIEAQFENMPV